MPLAGYRFAAVTSTPPIKQMCPENPKVRQARHRPAPWRVPAAVSA